MNFTNDNRFSDTPLAVIGMGCRLPGANDLDEYWSLMIEGRSAIAELPASRLDQGLYYDPEIGRFGKTYSRIGGIVHPRRTPPESFRLSIQDIENADHSHLELCQIAAQAIRDAGLDPKDPKHQRSGVFVGHQRGSSLIGDLTLGVMANQAMDCLRQTQYVSRLSAEEQTALVTEIAGQVRRDLPKRRPGGGPFLESSEASRLISKAFGLDGPCMSINAACSSSLVALAAGAHALQMGDIEMAVIGGLSNCKLDALILFSQAQTVSGTGSRPFDADADGLVAAEGYVVVLVKTLERALADKDPIRAVIRGIGVSSDGKGKSLWAPRREGQIAAVQRAYSAEVMPNSVQYVEAHATSTPVGDWTEVNSLAEAFTESVLPGQNQKIPIGSVKANIGHTLEAAGLAGLIKTVLAMEKRLIPPVINLRNPNPKVDWDSAPFQLPTAAIAWPDPSPGGPRRAGVNAFGIGGLNVHVVLEEHAPNVPVRFRPLGDPSRQDRSIAVVGAALLAPGAQTIQQFWSLLSDGRDPKTAVPADRWDVSLEDDDAKAWVGGFIRDYHYDWRRHRIPPKQVANADPLQFMILDTVAQALQDSGHESKLDHERTAVIVANLVGGESSSQLLVGLRLPALRQQVEAVLLAKGVPPDQVAETSEKFAELLLKRMPAILDETGGFSNSSLASRITKTYDLMGGAFALDSSDNSSIIAIDTARRFLLRGGCKMVIAAGAQRDLGPHAFESLRLSGRLSPTGHVRSLDQNSDGMAPAEGVAVVLLKKLVDAQADGDEILSVIREIGVARNDDPQTAQRLAIGRALRGAGVKPEQISTVELSAGGVPDEDRDEFDAIANKYAIQREHPIHLRSLAGQIGHAGGAAGMMALVKATLSLKHLQSPVGLPPDQPIRSGSNGPWFEWPRANQPLPLLDSSGRVFSALNSVSRGMACHVVMERGQPVQRPASPPAPGTASRSLSDDDHGYRTWICEADSLADLIDTADQIAANATVDVATVPRHEARYGLAIVYRTADELREKSNLFVSCQSHPRRNALLERHGVYCIERTRRPLVAFLFPGQGSQYAGMLKDLVQGHRVAATAAVRIDEILRTLEFPSYQDLVVDQADRLGNDVWHTQLSLLVTDSIVMEVVVAMGLQPDRISAHSYGEFPALVAAGAWSFADAAVATYHRCRLITESSQTDGVMLACDLHRNDAQQHCDAYPGEAFVANCNSDEQTVIAGSRNTIVRLHAHMKDLGIQARILKVPRPYHTPLMAPIQPPFRECLRHLDIAPPRTPLLSSVDNRYVAEPDLIRENLVRQLVEPVLYTNQIRRLASEGVRVLVEIGPSQVLTGLHQQTVGDDLLLIATDHKKRHYDETLARLDAALRAAGVLANKSADPSSASTDSRRYSGSKQGLALPESTPEAGLQLLILDGSPRDMGAAHGAAMAAPIRRMLDRYKEIAAGKFGRTLPDLSFAKSTLDNLIDESALEEVRGMAEAADVPLESLLEHNLYAYPEIGAGCTQILASRPLHQQRDNTQWLQAANEDMPLGLFLRDTVRRCVQVRRPTGGLPHLLFSTAGHVLGINGVNAAGVVVTSSMLLDRPRRTETLDGLLHSIVVRRVLETASSVDNAVDLLQRQRVTGGWGMCLSDAIGSQPAYVEYDGKTFQSKRVSGHHLVSNHAQLLHPVVDAPQHSLLRQRRLESLWRLNGEDALSIATLQRWLRDQYDEGRGREVRFPTMNTIRRVDNQVSVLFDVQQARAWATAGKNAAEVDEDHFFELDLKELIGFNPGRRQSPPVTSPPNSSLPNLEKTPEQEKNRVISWPEFSRLATSVDGHSPVNDAEKICNRFALRLIEVPPTAEVDVAATLHGGVVLLGDNAVADALAKKLQTAGVRCLHLRRLDDAATALSDLNTFCQPDVPTNLFLLTAFDPTAPTDVCSERWRKRREPGVLVPYQICQRWLTLLKDAEQVGSGRIVGGVRLGGMLGFDDNVSSPEGGFATGLIKGLLLEQGFAAQTSFRACVVDFDADADADANFVAARLIDESATAGGRAAEIAYRDGKRHSVAPVNRPVETISPINNDFGNVWVVTGGARGVTAKIAKAIGQQFGVKLHLIGSSPLPEIDERWRNLSPDERKQLRTQIVRDALEKGGIPIEAWSKVEKALEIDGNLRDFTASGLDVTYHACDVSDHQALARLIDKIRRTEGRIDGVVHGAGFEKAASFTKKKPEWVRRTIASKVDGAVSLIELTRQDDLKVFAAFASISGRFGGVGQTDYCIANELLCKLVGWLRKSRPEVHAVAFDWPSWDEVGMAVRPESKLAKTLVDAKFMPVDEGVRHFIEELRRGCPEAEVLITDWERYKRYYTDPYVASLNPYPMIDRVESLGDRQDQMILTSHVVDPVNDSFLSQHLLRGKPILPFVAAAESFAEAASLISGSRAVTTIENFRIAEAMRFFTDDPQEIRVRAQRAGNQIHCTLLSDFRNRKGFVLRKDRVHAECTVRLDVTPDITADDVQFPDVDYLPVAYLDHKVSVYHGPIYRQLEAFSYSEQASWAKIRIADPAEFLAAGPEKGTLLPCVLIDTCVFSAGVHEWTIDRTAIALPQSIERLRVFASPAVGEQVVARIIPLQSTDNYAIFNIDVWDPRGRPLLQIEKYRANVLVATVPLNRAQTTR